MDQHTSDSLEFWIELERNVASKVGDALKAGRGSRDLLIGYLRDLEIMARSKCDRRQTIQIIASGRSVLGDRSLVGPVSGPFERPA
jgi:hypothetical protein